METKEQVLGTIKKADPHFDTGTAVEIAGRLFKAARKAIAS